MKIELTEHWVWLGFIFSVLTVLAITKTVFDIQAIPKPITVGTIQEVRELIASDTCKDVNIKTIWSDVDPKPVAWEVTCHD